MAHDKSGVRAAFLEALRSRNDMPREDQSYWMIVESANNWEADREHGFSSLGISERFARAAASMRKGDFLISYVSKGGFADVRVVDSDEVARVEGLGHYDRPFPLQVMTRSLLALDRKKWVSVKPLLDKLKLTRGKANWSWVFRTSVKLLDKTDGKMLLAEVQKAASEG